MSVSLSEIVSHHFSLWQAVAPVRFPFLRSCPSVEQRLAISGDIFGGGCLFVLSVLDARVPVYRW